MPRQGDFHAAKTFDWQEDITFASILFYYTDVQGRPLFLPDRKTSVCSKTGLWVSKT